MACFESLFEGSSGGALQKVFDTRQRRLRNRSITEHLVKWKGLPLEDATWEGTHILEHPSLYCLRKNNIWEGGLVMSPFQNNLN